MIDFTSTLSPWFESIISLMFWRVVSIGCLKPLKSCFSLPLVKTGVTCDLILFQPSFTNIWREKWKTIKIIGECKKAPICLRLLFSRRGAYMAAGIDNRRPENRWPKFSFKEKELKMSLLHSLSSLNQFKTVLLQTGLPLLGQLLMLRSHLLCLECSPRTYLAKECRKNLLISML